MSDLTGSKVKDVRPYETLTEKQMLKINKKKHTFLESLNKTVNLHGKNLEIAKCEQLTFSQPNLFWFLKK